MKIFIVWSKIFPQHPRCNDKKIFRKKKLAVMLPCEQKKLFAFSYIFVNSCYYQMLKYKTFKKINIANNIFFIHRTLPKLMLKNLIYVLGISLLLKIFWPFIPFFICDIMFWWMLFISPFDAVNRLCRRLNSIRNTPVNREVQQNNAGWQFAFRFGRQ